MAPTFILRPARRKIYTPISLGAFYLVGAFAVLPVFGMAGVGLSITAPLFLFVALPVFLNPPNFLQLRYAGWALLAAAMWSGIFLSFLANGPLSPTGETDTLSVLTVVRYAYWLLLFVVTGYFAANQGLLRRLSAILAAAVTALAAMRWFEAIAWGKIGAWTGTTFLTQNDYGGLFSTFSPFLLALLFERRGLGRFFAAGGFLILWGAAAINGSRGSWVGMGVGLLIFIALYSVTNPGRAWRVLVPLFLGGALLAGLGLASERVRDAMLSRFMTMGQLKEDKSFMIRQVMNQKSLHLFRESPLLGAGPGRYRVTNIPLDLPEVFSRNAEEGLQRKSAHNSYLLFLAENGLAAAIPYGLLLLALALMGWRAALRLGRQHRVWALAIYAGFMGMTVHFWAMSALTNTAAWFMYGLVVAMILLARASRKGRSQAFQVGLVPILARPAVQLGLTSQTAVADK